MQATVGKEGSTPFPTNRAPTTPSTENVDVNATSTVLSTGVLSLEYSVDGEELELVDLTEPFLLELDLAEALWMCEALGNFVLCEDTSSCVPTGSCEDRAHQYCSFYDVKHDEWVVDDDAPPGNLTADGRRIVCEFKHLTDVASFMGSKPSDAFNKPCFSCLNEFLKNPAGIVVVTTCLFCLLFTMCLTVYRYYQYSYKEWDEIAAMKFAIDRHSVLTPDRVYPTTLLHDLSHRMRHDL